MMGQFKPRRCLWAAGLGVGMLVSVGVDRMSVGLRRPDIAESVLHDRRCAILSAWAGVQACPRGGCPKSVTARIKFPRRLHTSRTKIRRTAVGGWPGLADLVDRVIGGTAPCVAGVHVSVPIWHPWTPAARGFFS